MQLSNCCTSLKSEHAGFVKDTEGDTQKNLVDEYAKNLEYPFSRYFNIMRILVSDMHPEL